MPRTRSIVWAELKLGIIAVVAIALASMLILAVGGQGGFFWERFPIRTRFTTVNGMKTGAVVRVAGKDVGKVTSVEFAGDQIEVGMEVSKDVRPLITDQSRASMGSLSLLGEPIVDITPAPQGTPVADGDYLVSAAAVGSIVEATTAVTSSLEEARQLIAGVRAGRGTAGKLFTDETIYAEMERFVASANDVATRLTKGRGSVAAMVNDPAAYNTLKASLDNLQAVTDRIRRGEGSLGKFLNDDAMAKSMAGSTANIEAITGRVNRGEGTVGKLLTDAQLYDRFNGLATRIDALVKGVEAGRGTAGMLLHDQQLYDTMNSAATELKTLIAEIRKDPRKYLTVRVSIFGG